MIRGFLIAWGIMSAIMLLRQAACFAIQFLVSRGVDSDTAIFMVTLVLGTSVLGMLLGWAVTEKLW